MRRLNRLFYVVALFGSIYTSFAFAGAGPDLKSANASMGMGMAKIRDWSTGYALIDFMKQARPWKDWHNREDKRPYKLDDSGWVTSLAEGRTAGTVFITQPEDRAPIFEKAVVLYEGDGEIKYEWAARKIESESSKGRDVIALARGSALLTITAVNERNPLRNIKIIPTMFWDEFERGEVFNPIWLEKIGRFDVLRYKDWQGIDDSKEERWSERVKLSDRSWTKSAPLELIVELTQQTDTTPWINFPHKVNDEFIRESAIVLKRLLKDDQELYIEFSNEVWNWRYKQTHYASERGKQVLGSFFSSAKDAYQQWYGMRTAQMCDVFKKEVFSDSSDRIKCVMSIHSDWKGLHKSALECPSWKARAGGCYKHGIDFLGITTYFNGGLNGPRKEMKEYSSILEEWASAGEYGLKQAFVQLRTGDKLRKIPGLEGYDGVKAELRNRLSFWKSEADTYGLKLIAYEGGQHVTANAHLLQDKESIINFHIAVNRHAEMGAIYSELHKIWSEYTTEAHVHFLDFEIPSKWGSWGALETFTDEGSPKWDAINQYLSK